MIAAGRLDKLVSIYRVVKGDAADTTQHVGKVWAEIRPLSSSERFRAGDTESDVSHVVTMRTEIDVTPAHKIQYGTRTLEIRGVRTVGKMDEDLEIDAAEVL